MGEENEHISNGIYFNRGFVSFGRWVYLLVGMETNQRRGRQKNKIFE